MTREQIPKTNISPSESAKLLERVRGKVAKLKTLDQKGLSEQQRFLIEEFTEIEKLKKIIQENSEKLKEVAEKREKNEVYNDLKFLRESMRSQEARLVELSEMVDMPIETTISEKSKIEIPEWTPEKAARLEEIEKLLAEADKGIIKSN